MSVSGIDIASYQSTSYDTAGLGFVLVKATEGSNYTNPRHAGQVSTGRAHALVVGHYHFVRPGPMTAQAAYFLQHAAAQPGDILILDWEDPGVSSADKDAWIRHVQGLAPTHRVILYCNRDFWLNRDTTSFCGDGLWIADPGSPAGHPKVEHPWTFHQYSESAGLDRDVANFASKDALRAWAAGQYPTPEDDMPLTDADRHAIAAEVVTQMTAPAARDALTNADLYWWERILNPGIAIPTGPSASNTARSAAALRPLVADILTRLSAPAPQLTDAQVGQLATALATNAGFAKTLAEEVAENLAARLQQ